MSLKQPHKNRIDESQIQYCGWDDDGCRKVMYHQKLFTGYLVLDRNPNGFVEFEKEYKNGSHLGWDNEYDQNEQLVRTTLTVGETSLVFYEYDSKGNQLVEGKLTDDGYFQKMVERYNLD